MKKLLISGVIFIIIGVVAFGIGFGGMDWNWRKLDTAVYESKAYNFTDEEVLALNEIKIDVNNASIEVMPATEKVWVDYETSNRQQIKVTFEDGTLHIEENYKWSMSQLSVFSAFNFGVRPIKIYLPAELTKLDFVGDNGYIKIKNMKIEELTIKIDNGATYINNVSGLKEMKIEMDNGLVDIKNVVSDVVKIYFDNGHVGFDKLDVKELLDIKLSNGNIEGKLVGAKTDFNIDVDKDNGWSNIGDQNNNVSKNLKVKLNNGRVSIKFGA